MKKKFISILLVALMLTSLVSCDDDNATTDDNNQNSISQDSSDDLEEDDIEEEDVYIIPEGTKEIGEGEIEINTPSGSSDDGNIPVLFSDKDTQLMQIGLETDDFNGSRLSHIYIDGKEVGKEQLADSKITLDLTGDMLKTGKHKVEVVQFDGDNIVTYKIVQYEVKEK